MQKTLELLRLYEQENEWLNTPYHKSIACVGNKCITVNPDGEYSFYYITNSAQFAYGQDMDPAYLRPLDELDETEQDALERLKTVSRITSKAGLQAMALRAGMGGETLIFCHDTDPERFFCCAADDYYKITDQTVKKALQDPRISTYQNPVQMEV